MVKQTEEATNVQKAIAGVISILIIVAIVFVIIRTFSFGMGVITDDTPEYEREEIKEKMEEHLYEKYGEEFVVYRIGRRRFGDTPFYQGRIYPKRFRGTKRQRNEYYQAKVNIDILDSGELRDPGDTYGRVIARKRAEEFLLHKVKEIFGDRVKLKPSISYYTRKQYDTMAGYLSSDFDKMLDKSVNDPENNRLEFDLNVYVFDRIEDDEEKEERREDIFEFVQYLQEEGLFEYLELGVIFIDERVLAESYDEFEREVRLSNKVREDVDGETVRMPPMDLREEMSSKLQKEVEKMSEEELLDNMQEIRKDELNYDDLRKYNGQYHTWIYSFGMLEERYSSSITEEDKERNYDIISDIELSKYKKYMYINQ